MNYREISDSIYLSNIEQADALILDCDGTLVNINDSYNACIKYTVGYFLESLVSRAWYDYVTDDLIQALRATGGFNNDIDTCYACILSAVASNTDDINKAREFALSIASKADARGIASVEEELRGYDLSRVKRVLNYPSSNSILARKFDEFFYGKELFKKIYGIDANTTKGFIEYDQVIITEECLDDLKYRFGDNIAIVSGRSRIATEYALKSMLNKFNLSASIFIEDEERNGNRIGKPDPYSIIRSMNSMGVKNAICVGDSVEDLLMSRNAMKYGYKVSFIGIYENGLDSNKQLNIFKELRADAIIKNINLLPKLLSLI